MSCLIYFFFFWDTDETEETDNIDRGSGDVENGGEGDDDEEEDSSDEETTKKEDLNKEDKDLVTHVRFNDYCSVFVLTIDEHCSWSTRN